MISSVRLRQWHAYIGLFIAPSILFFAITGAIQIFSLHEAHGSYHPPVLLEKLGAVHKDQVFERPHEDKPHGDEPQPGAHPGAAPDEHPTDDDEKTSVATYALKWFFTIVALGLTVSTCIGVWMGLTQTRRKTTGWCCILAGALIPLCLLAL
jgi:hypothetical protein